MIFNSTPLDSSIPINSFIVNTEWIVFTGAPCSGKTTTIKELGKLGFEYKEEVARRYFELNSRDDEALSQLEITDEKLVLENSLNPIDKIILDRGIPDSITYYRTCGLDPCKAFNQSMNFKYSKVFIFENLPIEKDGIRTENENESVLIQKWLMKDYSFLGYNVIVVPVDSIENRVNFIKELIEG